MNIKQLVKLLKKNNQQVELYYKSTYRDCGKDGDCFRCVHCDDFEQKCTLPDEQFVTETTDFSLFKGRPFEIPIAYSDATVISISSEYYYPYKKSHGPESKIRIEIKEHETH